MTTDVFENVPQPAEPVETLVGEGKKYATVELALEALAHSQSHIQRLETEARERKAQEDLSTKFESLVAKIEANQQPAYVPPAPDQATPPVPAPANEDLIRQVIREDREKEVKSSNINQVGAKLIEQYGTREKANEVIVAKAAELGVSVEFLQDVAARSPKAFYTTLGLNAAPVNSPAPSQGSVTVAPSPLGAGKPGTYSFYKELQRTSPRDYLSPKIQLEMHNAALKFGEGWTQT